jgi:hypothetical protein
MPANFASAVRNYKPEPTTTVHTTATAVDASHPWVEQEQPVEGTHQPPAENYGYAEPEPEPESESEWPLFKGNQESDQINAEPGRWAGYLNRVSKIFSPALGGSIFLRLVTGDVPFLAANLTMAAALFYPLLIAAYLWSARTDQLTKPMVVAIMVIAISPFGLIFGSDLMAVFLTTASYFIFCIDSKRSQRKLQNIHSNWAGFCFGIIAMGLK